MGFMEEEVPDSPEKGQTAEKGRIQKPAKIFKFRGMKKKKMGRPPKPEEERLLSRFTLQMTKTVFKDLKEYERLTGKNQYTSTARELFLESLYRNLEKARKAISKKKPD